MLGQHPELAAIDVFRACYIDHCVFGAVQHGVRDWDGSTAVPRCTDRQLLSPEGRIQVEHGEAVGAGARL
jgi:hypothetical protein